MDLLVQIPLGKPREMYSKNWWNYHSKRIYSKINGSEIQQGVINLFRICKSKWIEELGISTIEKNKLHKRMQHTYGCVADYYS